MGSSPAPSFFEEHSGYVEIAGKKLGATIRGEGDRLHLDVLDPEPNVISTLPDEIELAPFVGHKTYFTLLRLFRIHSSGRFGLGGISKYQVNLAVQEGMFASPDEVKSDTWLLLAIDEVSLRLQIEDRPHSMRMHGLLPTQRSENPSDPIALYTDATQMGALIDRWLGKFEGIKDAIHLHFDSLEQRRLPMQMRFQLFVQALEALHRRTHSALGNEIDRGPIISVLEERGLPDDVVDRVNGILAHAHEPGLRQRLKSYWDDHASELSTLRPDSARNDFVSRVAATRNFYAHGLDRDSMVLEGEDLWNHTETLKAIVHLALLHETGFETGGIGQRMLDRRFAQFSLGR